MQVYAYERTMFKYTFKDDGLSGAEGMSHLETLKKLRGCIEFKDKEKMLSEIYALRAERRL